MPSNTRKTELDYHALAENRGYVWIGTLPHTVNAHTLWRCLKCKYEWQSTWSHIQQGTGCPKCGRNARLTELDYQNVGKMNNIEWIGNTLPLRAKEQTMWRCAKGHTWSACHSNIKSGYKCPQCHTTFPKTLEDYHELARQRGFTYLESSVTSVHSKGRWMCSSGHVWLARFSNINKGSGCPHCVDYINGVPASKIQRKLHGITGGELNYPVGRKRIDIALWIDDLAIALEYDSHYWHESEEKDLRRARKLIDLGWRVLRIKSGELLPTEHQLNDAIDTLLSGATYVEIVLPDWKG